APYGKEDLPAALPWPSQRPLCVTEFTVENPQPHALSASLELTVAPGTMQPAPEGAIASQDDKLLASIDLSRAAPLRQEAQDGIFRLSGVLPSQGKARCTVTIPGWEMKPQDSAQLSFGLNLLDDVETYWKGIMAPAMQLEIPDPQLLNAIRSQQVQCLI